MAEFWGGLDPIMQGLLATIATGLASAVGALPVLFTTRVSERVLDTLLGFAAGVMLAATAFSLIVPAIELSSVWVAGFGLIAGAVFLSLMDKVFPHLHVVGGREGPSSHLRRVWLLIIAITLHNFPEGMAVGVGFGSGDAALAIALALAIGLQNMPEGLAVALPLAREGYSRWSAVGYALLSGLAEPIAGLIGAAGVTVAAPVLPWALAFAGGAMLFVVSDEIIPETHSRGFQREGTFGVIAGFVVMMLLDNLFG